MGVPGISSPFDAPTPTLPRMRGRERTAAVAATSTQNRYVVHRFQPTGATMLRITRDLSIDENDIEIGFVRASGPGG